MSVNQTIDHQTKQIRIEINDRFDFSLHQKFRDAYINCDEKAFNYVVDLTNTEYMDSSALGMLLLLKDHAQTNQGQVILKSPNDTVGKVLEIAQFHRLFQIEA